MATINLSGGDKLQAKLAEMGKRMSGRLDVGFFEGETYPDGTSVPTVAFWNEFGTSEIPSRPFFRAMIAEKSPAWGSILGKSAEANNFDGQESLSTLGQVMKEQLSGSINGWTVPSNAPSTIAKKGFDKPLIDSGQLLRAPEYKVSP